MGNTPSDIVDPQKGLEEIKTLRIKATSLNNKQKKEIRLTLIKLISLQKNAVVRLKGSRSKVLKLRQLELKLRQRGTMSDLTKSRSKELEKKVQLNLRIARSNFEQDKRNFNALKDKGLKIVESLFPLM